MTGLIPTFHTRGHLKRGGSYLACLPPRDIPSSCVTQHTLYADSCLADGSLPARRAGNLPSDHASLQRRSTPTNDLDPYEVRLLHPSPHEQAEHSVSRLSLCAVVLTLSALRGASSQTETELIFLSKFDILNDGTNGSRSERRGGSERSSSSMAAAAFVAAPAATGQQSIIRAS